MGLASHKGRHEGEELVHFNSVQFDSTRLGLFSPRPPSPSDGSSSSSSSSDWTPILILVPLTLGLGRNINPLYIPSIVSILEAPQTLGFIGGKPGASLYFFGYQNQHFLSLDPHRPQVI